METLSFDRSLHFGFSKATASGSSEWHVAHPPELPSTQIPQGWTVTPLAAAATATTDKASQLEDAAVTIASVEVPLPQRCRLRKGNGDGDVLVDTGVESRVIEVQVEVEQRMGRKRRRVDKFQR